MNREQAEAEVAKMGLTRDKLQEKLIKDLELTRIFGVYETYQTLGGEVVDVESCPNGAFLLRAESVKRLGVQGSPVLFKEVFRGVSEVTDYLCRIRAEARPDMATLSPRPVTVIDSQGITNEVYNLQLFRSAERR